MSQVRAWTLEPSVTCGKSFRKRWKENALLYSPHTGKKHTHTKVAIYARNLLYLVRGKVIDWQLARLITVCSRAFHLTLCLSFCISAWKSVRRCVAVLPSWWKDSSDVWAPCSTLRTGLWPPLIFHSDHYCSTSPFLTLCVNTIRAPRGPLDGHV